MQKYIMTGTMIVLLGLTPLSYASEDQPHAMHDADEQVEQRMEQMQRA